MTPSSPVFNSANGVLTDPIVRRYFGLLSCVSTNSDDIGLFKFCRSASFSAIRSVVNHSISLVILRGIPSKIINGVVGCISIIVTALHSFRGGATESNNDKPMNLSFLVFVIAPKKNKLSGRAFLGCLHLNPSSFYGLYVAKVTYLIDSFKSNHIAPFFHNHNSIDGVWNISMKVGS